MHPLWFLSSEFSYLPGSFSKHKMSASMTLEEKFEALMKSYQSVSSSNQELKNQNEYLGRQLRELLKQKEKAVESPTESGHGEVRPKVMQLN